jgi:hypothetical protein
VKYSYKGLKLAQLLGELGVFLTSAADSWAARACSRAGEHAFAMAGGRVLAQRGAID